MKLISAALLMMITGFVQAKGCDIELQGGLRITSSALEFTQGENPGFTIINDQTLVVDGRVVSLNPKQQFLVTQYASSIRALLPEVRQLTLDGVDLASQALDLAFQELLEPDNQIAQKVHNEFMLLKKDIETSFASNRPININQKGIRDHDFLGMDFETRIGKILGGSGKDISWNIIKSLGTAIFSDDKRGDLETRMNKVDDRIKREMKVRSEKLERHGDVVCSSISLLDRKEEELKKSIKEISSFNLILLNNDPPLPR